MAHLVAPTHSERFVALPNEANGLLDDAATEPGER
jgi:hypothetical protein